MSYYAKTCLNCSETKIWLGFKIFNQLLLPVVYTEGCQLNAVAETRATYKINYIKDGSLNKCSHDCTLSDFSSLRVFKDLPSLNKV